MDLKDLIKKIENTKIPEIKIENHKQELKQALLNSGYFNKKSKMIWVKKSAPALLIGLLIIGVFSFINPWLQQAKAIEIAKNDGQVKQIMASFSSEPQEVKIQKDKAYVLFGYSKEQIEQRSIDSKTLPAYGVAKDKNDHLKFFTSYVAEVNLKEEKVIEVKILNGSSYDISTLEKEKAVDILKQDPTIKQSLPTFTEQEASVKLIPPYQYNLKEEPSGEIKAIAKETEDKRVNVLIETEDQKEIITVNLTKEEVENSVSTENVSMYSLQEKTVNESIEK